MVANFSTAKQLWWPDYLQQNDLKWPFFHACEQSPFGKKWLSHIAQGALAMHPAPAHVPCLQSVVQQQIAVQLQCLPSLG